jgi:serine phosphatase RsbU (regulator of sigma subunit)/pSer/pThr/pTyr-binding forkhead associated (FHA) protein
MTPHLVFVAGPNSGRRYKLGDGEYIIGRRSDCQIFVPDMRVSRQHARITRDSGRWCLEDLGSNNGTFVNGSRVQTAELRHDDEIQIAQNRIRVELPEGQTNPGKGTFDSHVTIVEVASPSVFKSREDSDERVWRSGVLTGSDIRGSRLMERKLAAITSILEAVSHNDDADTLLDRVVEQLLEVFPQAESVGVLVEDERTRELRVKCHRQRKAQAFGGDLRVPGTIIEHVVHDRRGVLLGDKTPLPGSIGAVGEEAVGTRMGAPLQGGNVHYGVIYVESKSASFRQEDVDLLGSVAAQTGLAIHATRIQNELARREQLERDLRVARQIQRSLLPATAPSIVGLEFAVHYEPAYQIGGDFYDFIWHDQSHLALAVGDVAGKAISAALYMARLTSELRSRAGISRTPARLLRRVNEEMVKLGDDGMFATLVYCIYDLESRTLVFTNAGHCVPLLRRGDRVFPLHAERAHIAPIGVMPELEVGEARVQLHSGDMLVLISDGIHEARDARGNEYGIKRLSRRIRTARGSVEEVVKAILHDVDSHVANAPQGDDMTIVAMNINEGRAKRRTSTIPGIPVPEQKVGTSTPPMGSQRMRTEDGEEG